MHLIINPGSFVHYYIREKYVSERSLNELREGKFPRSDRFRRHVRSEACLLEGELCVERKINSIFFLRETCTY